MNNITRLFASAGLALAMAVALPSAAGAAYAPGKPVSCKVRPCAPQICTDIGTCPSPKPPAA